MLRHSFRAKLILLLFIATVLPISTSMLISYFYTKQSVTDNVIQSTQANLSLARLNLLNYMDAVNQSTLLIYSGINQRGSIYSLIEDLKFRQSEAEGFVPVKLPPDAIRSEMLSMLRSVRELYKIHLYTLDNQMSYLQVNDFHRSLPNPD